MCGKFLKNWFKFLSLQVVSVYDLQWSTFVMCCTKYGFSGVPCGTQLADAGSEFFLLLSTSIDDPSYSQT